MTKDIKTDLHYYMDSWAAAISAGTPKPSKEQVVNLGPKVKDTIGRDAMGEAMYEGYQIYQEYGADAKATKGSQMRDAMFNRLKERSLPARVGEIRSEFRMLSERRIMASRSSSLILF